MDRQAGRAGPARLVTQLGVHLGKVDLARRHLVCRIVEIVFEQLEILFEDLAHQMHRQIVKVILDRMRPLGPVALAFVEPGDRRQINLMRRVHGIEHLLHAAVKLLGPKDIIVGATVDDESDSRFNIQESTKTL